MNFKPAIFLLLLVFAATFFSACTSVESKNSEEVVIEDKSQNSSGEVVITNADIKDENQQISVNTTQATSQLGKRLLSDKSEIITSVDGFGTKTEIRYFPGNTRIRSVSLRTAADGSREVTVYGADGSAKIVSDLGDDALTLPSDRIASTAQLGTTPSSPVVRNYMKRRKVESQTPLQPLPSSAFQQQPTIQYPQPVEPVQPQTNADNQNQSPQEQQNNREEK